jgi:hypothetical protein
MAWPAPPILPASDATFTTRPKPARSSRGHDLADPEAYQGNLHEGSTACRRSAGTPVDRVLGAVDEDLDRSAFGPSGRHRRLHFAGRRRSIDGAGPVDIGGGSVSPSPRGRQSDRAAAASVSATACRCPDWLRANATRVHVLAALLLLSRQATCGAGVTEERPRGPDRGRVAPCPTGMPPASFVVR